MPKFRFDLAFVGVDLNDEEAEEQLMLATPYALWGVVNGEVRAMFAVESSSPTAAALKVVQAVREVAPDASVVRIIEDLVSVSDIAERTGFQRQHVRMLAKGERGPGDFPPPRGEISRNQLVWDWAPVRAWFEVTYKQEFDDFVVLDRDAVTAIWQAIRRFESSTTSEVLEPLNRPSAWASRDFWVVAAEQRGSYDLHRRVLRDPVMGNAIQAV